MSHGLAGLLCAAVGIASAQRVAPPAIGQNGAVNAASRIPPTLAGGNLAPGAQFTITGVRLGSLGHTSVTFSHGGVTLAAQLIAVSAERIDAIVPGSAPLGEASLVVTVDGQASTPFPVHIEASNPGLFSANGSGWGPGAIDNLDSRGARRANSIINPAHPGERVILRSTGLGSKKLIRMIVGGRVITAEAVVRGRRPGEEEIAARLPADAPQGCYVPVYLLAAPERASNVVTVSIRSGGGPCEAGAAPLFDASRIGVAVVTRSRTLGRRAKRESIYDEASVTFAGKDSSPVLSPLLLLPPPGSCTAYSGSFQQNTVLTESITDALVQQLEGRGLDAGPALTLMQGSDVRSISHEHGIAGFYRGHLGNSAGGRRSLPLFLEPGEFTLSSAGGKDVGPFTVRFTGPTPFEWTNRDDIAVVDRTHALAVRWDRGRPGGVIVILATNVDQITTAIGTVLCAARAADGRFDVPAALLANVPASRTLGGIPYDQLFVAQLPGGPFNRIQASGIRDGMVVSIYSFAKFVEYR